MFKFPTKLDYLRFWDARERMRFFYKKPLWLLFVKWFLLKERWRYLRNIPQYTLVREIDALRQIEYGWGEGEFERETESLLPIDEQNILNAIKFTQDSRFPYDDRPRVLPMSDGRLQLEWQYYTEDIDIALELEFNQEDGIHYLKWLYKNKMPKIEEEGVVHSVKHNYAFDLVKWFHNEVSRYEKEKYR